jgi:hypothetical protein
LLDGLSGLFVVFLDVLFEAVLLDFEPLFLCRQVGDAFLDALEFVPELLVGSLS